MQSSTATRQDPLETAGDAGRDGSAVEGDGRTEDRAAKLARLRRTVRAIERGDSGGGRAMPLGVPAIDAALGGTGLPLACLHAVEGTAADGFAAAVAGRLLGSTAGNGSGVVVWCAPAAARARLYPSGLLGLGLDPNRLILVFCHRRAEMLAVMEDALRSGAPALVAAELAGDPDPLTSRRLQLACEAGGVTGLLLLAESGGDHRTAPAAFHSRWRIEPAPMAKSKTMAARWRLALVRNRGGVTGCWDVDWDGATHRFALAAEIGNRASGHR